MFESVPLFLFIRFKNDLFSFFGEITVDDAELY